MKKEYAYFPIWIRQCFSYLGILIFLAFIFKQPGFCYSIFEGAKGEDVVAQFWKGSIIFNSANKSIKLGYTFHEGTYWCFALDVSGKAINGIATLLKSGNLNPGVKINLNIGYTFNSEFRRKARIVYNKIYKVLHDIGQQQIVPKYKKRAETLKEGIEELDQEIKSLNDSLDKFNKKRNGEKGEGITVVLKEKENLIKELLKEKNKRLEELKKEKEKLEKEMEKEFDILNKKLEKIIKAVHRGIDLKELDGFVKDKLSNLYEEFKKVSEERFEDLTLPNQTSWINLKVGYERAKYKLFSSDVDYNEQITDKLFEGLSAQLSVNSYLGDYNTLVRLALGISHANNASELKQVELTEETIHGNSGQTVRTEKKTIIARQGAFNTFTRCHLLLSGFWKPPKLPVGVLTYGRYTYSKVLRTLHLGIGGYVLKLDKKKRVMIPVGGILVEYGDKFSPDIKEVSFGNRFTVSLVVSIPLLTK